MTIRYTAAAIQYESSLHQKDKNVADLVTLTEEAADHGAKLIVLPEMATTAICWYDRNEVTPYVEPAPGPTTELFGRVAARHGCYIAFGFAEVDPATDIYYNSAALIGPQGIVGVYRKTHLFLSEPKWAKDGDLGIPVWPTEIGNLGLIICHDAAFIETCRIAALQGADVICIPTNWLERSPSAYWFTRAYDNGAYLVAANRYGVERGTQFSGNSCIIDPAGTLLASRDTGDGIVYAEIDLAQARRKAFPDDDVGSKFRSRRPRTYSRLMLNTYLWNPKLFHGLYGHRPLSAGCRSKIAVMQWQVACDDPAANLAKIESLLQTPQARSADLIVMPELATVGIGQGSQGTMDKWAEPIPGPTTGALSAHTQRTGQYFVIGLPERDGNHLFNTAVLIGPDGVMGKYRQAHLDRRGRGWATPGDLGFPTFDIPLGRVGLLVGHDINFPEAALCLALDAADVLCVPSAATYPAPAPAGPTTIPYPPTVNTGEDPLHWFLWRQRSVDNSVYLAFANQVGDADGVPYLGRSAIFQPAGFYERIEVVAPPDSEAVVVLDMDTTDDGANWPSCPVRLKEFLGLRQPHLYPLIVNPTPPVMELWSAEGPESNLAARQSAHAEGHR